MMTFYFVYPNPSIFVPDTEKCPSSWLIHLRYGTKKSLKNKENLAILKAKIGSGEILPRIRTQQQAKHIEGTFQFEQYKVSRLAKGQTPQSILTVTEQEAQTLVNSYSGTGTVEIQNNSNYTRARWI